ncbi:replication protein A 70 kDa dna-binding subunit-like, partial [Trifolium medium]|nr:replication protein A 70 kDa dna-binding subunit-like [Trifolium medium]
MSAISKSLVLIDPEVPEAQKLRSWYDSEGKDTAMAALSSGSIPSNSGNRSVYSDRVTL